MKTIVNRIPNSKVISIIKEDKDKRFLVKETVKSHWTYFAVEYKSQKLNHKMERFKTIADEISMRQKLIHSTSMDNYLLSTGSIKTSANNGNVNTKIRK